MPNKRRRFECQECGWKSSEFGNQRKIDQEKLTKAQKEWRQHKAEKHSEMEVVSLRVIFDEPFRY